MPSTLPFCCDCDDVISTSLPSFAAVDVEGSSINFRSDVFNPLAIISFCGLFGVVGFGGAFGSFGSFGKPRSSWTVFFLLALLSHVGRVLWTLFVLPFASLACWPSFVVGVPTFAVFFGGSTSSRFRSL